MPAELLPRSVTKTDGPAYWFLNGLNVVLATSESTGGAYSMLHHTGAQGNATPYHLHHVEDEAFYVLEGEFTFICQGEKTVVGPGGYMFLPRGMPHGIRCTGSGSSTMLILAMAEPAHERVLPPVTAPDLQKLAMLCAKYGIDILGPLPE